MAPRDYKTTSQPPRRREGATSYSARLSIVLLPIFVAILIAFYFTDPVRRIFYNRPETSPTILDSEMGFKTVGYFTNWVCSL